MPATDRRITPADLMPDADYAKVRKARRAALLPAKRLRRVALGPFCTLIFETYDTMLFQVQEMLLTEGGGEAQIADELAAYNPLIPAGRELVATVLFEIEDPTRRGAILASLGGVDEHFFIAVDGRRAGATPEGDVERTREDGKASSVHFLRFPLTDADSAAFARPETQVVVGCDHPHYSHMAVLPVTTRTELAKDIA